MDGTRDNSVVDLLRKCAAQDHGMARLRDALRIGLESGWQQRCLARVADMMEAELEELKAKVAELVEKLDSFEGEAYFGGTIVDWYEMAVRMQAQVDDMRETHMELPVDADGVPIRPGDMLTYDGIPMEVIAVSDSPWFDRHPTEMLLSCEDATSCRHVKPDTVEGMLDSLQNDVLTAQGEYAGEVIEFDEFRSEIGQLVSDYAERIRKAVEE